MKVAAPALGLSETPRQLANLEGDFIEDLEVRIGSLRLVKPVSLGGMGRKCFALGRKDGTGINKGFHRRGDAERVAEAVGME